LDISATALKPAQRSTLWDHAYSELKKALRVGRFRPGQRLLLRDIAIELNISPTPVRDAINRLVAERVLERGIGGQKGGATVPMIKRQEFAQFIVMRSLLESRLAFDAAAYCGDRDIQELQSSLKQMKRLALEHRSDLYLEEHRKFHFSIYSLSTMGVLYDTVENLWLRCGPMLNMIFPEYLHQVKKTDFHAQALAALKRKDAEGVAQAVKEDIEQAGHYICDILERQ
jgi:DNA-binding GntR family transcriptional regulator